MTRHQNTMLCLSCKELLSVVKKKPPGTFTGVEPERFKYPQQENAWTGSHHVEPGGFLEAVNKKCYICCTIYKDCSNELRKQAHSFRTFYQLRAMDADGSHPHLEDHYELNFITEMLKTTKPIADKLVFDCTGVFKIIPKKEVAASGMPLKLTDNTFTDECKIQVRQWLDDCTQNHESCTKDWRIEHGSPARLLYIDPISVGNFRIENFENGSRPPKYVTLSHCWGAGMTVTLTTTNQESLSTKGAPIASLPKRFEDAMKIANWLKVDYIWIDALCIIQDSKRDWLTESTKMGDIYMNSFCNIAATSADPEKGCFTDRLIHMVEPYPLPNPQSQDEEETYVIGYDDFWGNSLLDAPLHTRGWVLQERLISPRTIHFGQEQIFWECQGQMACEAYPKGIPEQFRNRKIHAWRQADLILDLPNKDSSSMSNLARVFSRLGWNWSTSRPDSKGLDWVYETWGKIVETYMECKLSFGEDKLVAISGIAQKVAAATNERYLAGLWENEKLPQSLLWYVLGRRQADNTPSKRSASQGHPDYRAPSWSWASVEAKVIWNWPVKCGKVLIDVLDKHIEQPKGSELAKVSSAHLKIQGHLFQACLWITNRDLNGNPEEDGLYTLKLCREDKSASTVSVIQHCSMLPTIYLDTPMMPNPFMEVFMLPVCTDWEGRSGVGTTPLAGLLLRRVASSVGQMTYERVGIFGLDRKQALALCGMRTDTESSVESSLGGVMQQSMILI